MSFLERLDNISVVDTHMFGFDKYMSGYLVKGKQLALIDTGLPAQIEAVRAGINAAGYSVSDISYIFITHEHGDHTGNVGPILRESPGASVYINPAALEHLVHPPDDARAIVTEKYRPDHAAKRGIQEPVPRSRIKFLKDGDVFDLGDGEKLKVIFAPGHQPGGLVLLEENNRGLFINDLVGNYFADADAQYCLNSSGVNHIDGIKSLQKLIDLPVKYLYLGHYGIVGQPKQVMNRAIKNMQRLLDIGNKYIREGKPELIAGKAYEMILPELEKLGKVRGEALFKYATQDHVGRQVHIFAQWCQDNLK